MVNKQAYQKSFHDRRGRWRQLEVGQTVLVENPAGGTKWVSGVIIEKLGSTSYEVQVGTQVWKRHIDQLLKGGNHMQAHADEEPDSLNSTPVDTVPTTETVESAGSQNIETSARNSDTQEVQDTVSTDGSTSQTSTTNVDSTTNMQTEGCQNNATLQRSGTPSKSTPTPAVVQNTQHVQGRSGKFMTQVLNKSGGTVMYVIENICRFMHCISNILWYM